MAVKASGRFVPPSAFAAGTGKAFTGAYAWNAPREAVGRESPLTRDEMRQVQGVLSTINRLPYFLRSLFTSRYDYIRRNKSRGGALMSCSRSVVLLNNALKIAVMKNGDLSLIQLGLDKEKREITESVIAIYQNELNLLSDVVNLLVKHAVFHKKISSVDELTKLTTEIASYYADEFKKLNDKRSW